MAIKETHKLKIEDRVFTKADVIKLGETLLAAYGTLGGSDMWQSFKLKVECDDDTSHEGEDLALLYTDIFDRKRITTIHMLLYCRKPAREIDLWLRQGRFSPSSVEVGGDDPEWVRGIFFTIENIIKEVKPQSNRFIKNPVFQWVVMTVTSNLFIYMSLYFFNLHLMTYKEITTIVICWLGYAGVGYALLWQLEGAWPRMEFSFGPEHRRTELRRRKWLTILSVYFASPIITAAIYDIIKAILR